MSAIHLKHRVLREGPARLTEPQPNHRSVKVCDVQNLHLLDSLSVKNVAVCRFWLKIFFFFFATVFQRWAAPSQPTYQTVSSHLLWWDNTDTRRGLSTPAMSTTLWKVTQRSGARTQETGHPSPSAGVSHEKTRETAWSAKIWSVKDESWKTYWNVTFT